VITRHGRVTPYPYDILGRQVLDWVDAAMLSRSESRPLLERAMRLLKQGTENHPRHLELEAVAERLKIAWMNTAAVPR